MSPATILLLPQQITQSSPPARLARALHDAISEGVNDTISGVNQGIGSGLRRQFDRQPSSKDGLEPSP